MTKIFIRILYALVFLSVSPICNANCTQDSALRAAVNDGYLPESDLLITCKVMPDNQQKTIVAYARETGFHSYTLTVLVVHNKKEKVLNRFLEEDPSFGPNGDPIKIEIDTARYIVSPGKRAFGIRVSHSLNSWDSTQDLYLYLEDGNKLKEILKGLAVSFSTSHAGYSNAFSVVISISKFANENFYDLVLTKHGESIEGSMDSGENGGGPSAAPVTSTVEQTIHFKNGAYDISTISW